MVHNVDIHKTENLPLVIINFLTDSVYLLKGEVMGFMQNQSLNISEIVTETSTEPSPILVEEDDNTEELPEQKRKITSANKEKKFIVSIRHRGTSKSRITRCQYNRGSTKYFQRIM